MIFMRPIVWGLILTALGAFLHSVLLSTAMFGFAGKVPPEYLDYVGLIYYSGLAMIFSLPITAVMEIYHWLKDLKAENARLSNTIDAVQYIIDSKEPLTAEAKLKLVEEALTKPRGKKRGS